MRKRKNFNNKQTNKSRWCVIRRTQATDSTRFLSKRRNYRIGVEPWLRERNEPNRNQTIHYIQLGQFNALGRLQPSFHLLVRARP